jgi:hypothetical protein
MRGRRARRAALDAQKSALTLWRFGSPPASPRCGGEARCESISNETALFPRLGIGLTLGGPQRQAPPAQVQDAGIAAAIPLLEQ